MLSNPYCAPTAATICTLDGYLYFVRERENIRLRREAGEPAPWTQDLILQRYKFTNVRRRDDRLSKWIEKNLIVEGSNRESPDLWFTLLIARLVNWPPTLQALLDTGVIPCSPEQFNALMFVSVIEQLPGKRYGGAYMVYPTMKDPGGVKSASLAKHIIGSAVQRREAIRHSLWYAEKPATVKAFVSCLAECFGISTFIAGQVANDLTWAVGHLDESDDLLTWAPKGPGSQKGLSYLHHKTLTTDWTQEDFNGALIEARGLIIKHLGLTGLSLHDVQNTFCEYSKYTRTVLGEGKPKTLYKPTTEY